MATLFDVESPSTLGYLDNTVYNEGRPVSAHLVRTASYNANKLNRRGQVVICSPFQHCATGNLGAYPYYGRTIVRPWWQLVFPPIPLRYRPGCTSATMYLTVGLSGDPVLFRFTTRATFSDDKTIGGGSAQWTKSSSGSFSTSITEIILDPSGSDELRIECTATDFSTRSTTGGGLYVGNGVLVNGMNFVDTGSTWAVDSSGLSHANLGHVIRFADSGAANHSQYYSITNVITSTSLLIWPQADPTVAMDAQDFEIFDAPLINIAGLLVVAFYDGVT